MQSVVNVLESQQVLSSHKHAGQEVSLRPSQSFNFGCLKVSRFVVTRLLNYSVLILLKASADQLDSGLLVSWTATWSYAVNINWGSE